MKVGIVGNGFVGNACAYGFSEYVPVYIHDKDPAKSVNSFEETVNAVSYTHLTLPTIYSV